MYITNIPSLHDNEAYSKSLPSLCQDILNAPDWPSLMSSSLSYSPLCSIPVAVLRLCQCYDKSRVSVQCVTHTLKCCQNCQPSCVNPCPDSNFCPILNPKSHNTQCAERKPKCNSELKSKRIFDIQATTEFCLVL